MTINEVSKRFGLSHETLRYYERIGLIPMITRNKSGIRDYSEKDCNWIESVKCMRSSGLPIEMLIEYRTLYEKGNQTINARKDLLIEQHKLLISKMEDMKSTIARLENKIERYKNGLMVIDEDNFL